MRTRVLAIVLMAGAASAALPALALAAEPPAATVSAGDEAYRAEAREMIAKAIAYLRAKQDPESGGWGVPGEGSERPVFPAVTGLVVTGMLANGTVDVTDPAIARAQASVPRSRPAPSAIPICASVSTACGSGSCRVRSRSTSRTRGPGSSRRASSRAAISRASSG